MFRSTKSRSTSYARLISQRKRLAGRSGAIRCISIEILHFAAFHPELYLAFHQPMSELASDAR